MKIISVWGKKGGIGKTTLCLALASALKARGYKVIVYDADPQLSAYNIAQSGSLDFDVIRKGDDEQLHIRPDITLVDLPSGNVDVNLNNSHLILAPCKPSQIDMAYLNHVLENEEANLDKPVMPLFNEWLPNREEQNKCIQEYETWARVKSRSIFERLNATGESLFGEIASSWAGHKDARADLDKVADEVLERLELPKVKEKSKALA
ncbi:ParA family protein [Serratia sp. Se-RSBMAAmG]|uniref:ParA family protein n=1 Tax=Serratia sp. Se-RSBMAAmG TaxID=3043305 RepID=UPI0024AF9F17|nr:ParA family protein [Serratia sp. Se-RSBMAAmG]MDI6976614.1 ParA family protein [Serratia sp. Se-RSBMAAmG]